MFLPVGSSLRRSGGAGAAVWAAVEYLWQNLDPACAGSMQARDPPGIGTLPAQLRRISGSRPRRWPRGRPR